MIEQDSSFDLNWTAIDENVGFIQLKVDGQVPNWWNLTKKSFKRRRSFKRDGAKLDGLQAWNGTVWTNGNWLYLKCARTVHFHSWRPSSFEPSWSNLNFRCKNGFFTSQPKISGFKFELTVPLYLYRHNISIYETFYWYSHWSVLIVVLLYNSEIAIHSSFVSY